MKDADADGLLRRRGRTRKGDSVANSVTSGRWFGPALPEEVNEDPVKADLQECVSTISVLPKQHQKRTLDEMTNG